MEAQQQQPTEQPTEQTTPKTTPQTTPGLAITQAQLDLIDALARAVNCLPLEKEVIRAVMSDKSVSERVQSLFSVLQVHTNKNAVKQCIATTFCISREFAEAVADAAPVAAFQRSMTEECVLGLLAGYEKSPFRREVRHLVVSALVTLLLHSSRRASATNYYCGELQNIVGKLYPSHPDEDVLTPFLFALHQHLVAATEEERIRKAGELNSCAQVFVDEVRRKIDFRVLLHEWLDAFFREKLHSQRLLPAQIDRPFGATVPGKAPSSL